MLVPSVVAAAPGDTPRPAAGITGHVVTETSQVLPKWTPSAGALTTYGQDVVVADPDPTSPTPSPEIHRRTTTNVTAAFGLFGHAELLFDLPLVLHQQGTTTDGTPESTGGLQASALGDLRLGVKGTILRTPRRGFGLGIAADVTAPTGDQTALSSTGGVQASGRVLAEQTMARGMVVAANVGYLARPELRIGDVVVDDSVMMAAALRVPIDRRQIVAWVGEVESWIGVARGASHPVTLRTGIRAQLRSGLVLGLYGGGSPVATLGVPQVQGMFAVHWGPPKRLRSERAFDGAAPARATEIARRRDRRTLLADAEPAKKIDPADPDGDGLLAFADRCPSVPEDVDGFQDDDGCPELDNDNDGLRDRIDHCPDVPELVNGALDWDGCPDRIVDGEVVPVQSIDPAQLVPKVAFAKGSAALDEETTNGLLELAELMRLNPWLGTLTLRVYVQPSNNPILDRGLAAKRAHAVSRLLEGRGVGSDRIKVEDPRAIEGGRQERARLAWADDPAAAIPDAPTKTPAQGDTLQRMLAGADQRAKDAVAAPEGKDHDFAQGPDATEPKPEPEPKAEPEPPQPESVSGAPAQPPAGMAPPPPTLARPFSSRPSR